MRYQFHGMTIHWLCKVCGCVESDSWEAYDAHIEAHAAAAVTS